MKNSAQGDHMIFFGAVIAGVIAIFVSSIIFLGTPKAHAYAVGSVSTDTGTSNGSYNFGNSLQTLISPFTGFISSLKWSNNTAINAQAGAPTFPVVNKTPVVESGVQNMVRQWFNQFGNWFYRVTNVQLSGILYVLLNAISWTLGLATNVVNWLLGLFH